MRHPVAAPISLSASDPCHPCSDHDPGQSRVAHRRVRIQRRRSEPGATADRVYDNLDFTHAFDAFVNTMQGVSIAAIDKGLQSVGVKNKPAVEAIKRFTKVYPYEAGGEGTPIAEFLAGKAMLGRITPPPQTVFHDGSGKVMNTIPPDDWTFFELLNEIVQREPATSLDPELMGSVAAIGIVKGKPFAMDARMKNIMTEALAVANATSRTLFMSPRDPSWYYYPNSAWWNTCSILDTSSKRRSR